MLGIIAESFNRAGGVESGRDVRIREARRQAWKTDAAPLPLESVRSKRGENREPRTYATSAPLTTNEVLI